MIAAVFAFVLAHKLIIAAGAGYALVSSGVDALPAPSATSSAGYRYFHTFANALALNLYTAMTAVFPRLAEIFTRPQA